MTLNQARVALIRVMRRDDRMENKANGDRLGELVLKKRIVRKWRQNVDRKPGSCLKPPNRKADRDEEDADKVEIEEEKEQEEDDETTATICKTSEDAKRYNFRVKKAKYRHQTQKRTNDSRFELNEGRREKWRADV
jgi:hypothetical protein